MPSQGQEDDVNWKGLFEWSMQFQGEGPPASLPAAEQAQGRALTEADRRWFLAAMQELMKDPVKRMREVKAQLDTPEKGQKEGGAEEGKEVERSVAQKEALLEELVEITENIDFARDLTLIGGLPTLLALLRDPHAGLRWRAAEVAATCAQANPPVQEAFLRGGALPPLLALLGDSHPKCRLKGLLAVSCLVRGYGAGLATFLQESGTQRLAALLAASPDEPRLQRKCLQLLREVVREAPGEAPRLLAATPLGAVIKQVSGPEADVREAALQLLTALAALPSAAPVLKADPQLHLRLTAEQARLGALGGEDAAAERDQRALVEALQERLSQPMPLRRAPADPPREAPASAAAAEAPPQGGRGSAAERPDVPLLGPP